VAARVVMYSRRTCGLCDKARAVVLSVRDGSPFEFDELFIDGDDGLERAYGLRVPVLEVNGRDAFEYEVDPDELRALVGR
jgi:glutaredoxin